MVWEKDVAICIYGGLYIVWYLYIVGFVGIIGKEGCDWFVREYICIGYGFIWV